MAPTAADSSPTAMPALLRSLLDCTPDAVLPWIHTYRPQLSLQFLQTLKETYALTSYILAEPVTADRATRYALIVAEQMIDEPLALSLARWARGLWAMFHAPEEAITLFQQAQSAYGEAGDTLSVARLNANLVGVLAECGRFAEAEVAYHAAYPEFLARVADEPIYLVRLNQNYGWLLYSQGRYAEALAILDEALLLARHHQLTTNITGIQVNRYLALGMVGRLAEVEAGFLQERAAAQAAQQLLTVARIEMNLGDLYSWQGQVAAALQHFQKAQQIFTTLGNEMEVASVLFRQAGLLNRIGARRAAIRCYTQALPRFRERHMLPQIGELLVPFAITHRHEGDYRQAARLLDEAERLWQALANPLWLATIAIERTALALARTDYATAQQLVQQRVPTDALRLQAEFHLLQADLWRLTANTPMDAQRAAQAYEAARQYATMHGERWIERRALVGLGKLWLDDKPTDATAFFEQAAAIDGIMRQMLTVEELKASFHEEANDLFDDLIPRAIAQKQGQQALGYIWRAKAGALLDLLQAVHERDTLSSPVIAMIEQIRQQIATLRWETATQADPTVPTPTQAENQGQIAALEQQLLELRRQRNYTATTEPPTSAFAANNNPAAVVATMDADLLFEYVRCDNTLWGVIADRQGNCKGLRLADVETMMDLHARLQLRFGNVIAQPPARRRQWNEQWLAECLPLLTACYQALVAPLLALLPAATATKILIAPCDPLFLLPFAAFWEGDQFWGETHQIEFIPSGALLGHRVPQAPYLSPPVIIAASAGTMTAVRTEADRVAATYPNSVTFVDRPALAYLNRLPTPPQLLHIAAHSLIRADAPLFTGLQLSGEVLTVEQSYELPLQGTELVTLSGCTTASGQESESALLAFQSAFLLAGAQRVLTTLWPIADDVTAEWMSHFYRFLVTGLTVPQALQQTQRACLTDPTLCHPALWAPFATTRR